MAVQPLNPFAGEVSQVISISLPSSVPAVKVDFRVNVFENRYILTPLSAILMLWSSGNHNSLPARSTFGFEFNRQDRNVA
jgi:hypothetical protein